MIAGNWHRGWVETCGARVLGVRLRPYTLGHEIAMRWLRSPLLSGGPINMHSLALAVYLCSCNDSELATRNIFSFRATLFIKLIQGLARARKMDLQTEVDAFAEYVNRANWRPITLPQSEDDESKRTLNTPRPYILLGYLMRTYGISEQVAMRMPLQRALVLYYSGLERDGLVDFMSEEKAIENEEIEL